MQVHPFRTALLQRFRNQGAKVASVFVWVLWVIRWSDRLKYPLVPSCAMRPSSRAIAPITPIVWLEQV
jgi:hypothetical protein